jgi:hypothetical protein
MSTSARESSSYARSSSGCPSTMPTLVAATKSRTGIVEIWFCARIFCSASTSATKPPVIAAVRVPPSAWMTSQSTQIVRSPISSRRVTARSERPISRWISCVRPPTLPADASRWFRVVVDRGSMPYSAVTQPFPELRRNGGTRSSTLAVQITRVSPASMRTEPSGCFT